MTDRSDTAWLLVGGEALLVKIAEDRRDPPRRVVTPGGATLCCRSLDKAAARAEDGNWRRAATNTNAALSVRGGFHEAVSVESERSSSSPHTHRVISLSAVG